MDLDWRKIKNEYIYGETSYRKLAEKYGIGRNTISARAKKENWVKHRQTQTATIKTKTLEKASEIIATKEANRIVKVLSLSDELIKKLEQAITELDSHTVINKNKVRTIEYKDDKALGKPTKEVIKENESIEVVQSLIDRKGLQQVATALKAVNDIVSVSEKQENDIEDLTPLAELLK